ncbi:ABC transporter permease [Conexibacter stalactiti]|uniref:ABC transporter permease n=1 Tax=Conexibacter stalactiti TaxID=1940611 RepID=A0ABU4HNI8_9ACTN|nr:ABC transporter permease [Conexibacter stalactiti]MDW5594866.1 ABC transporter permease [Conexibacter stalactiti]MEC5035508.1 ABC transporter permease [Conexibacter stalactiti]
MSDLLAFVFLGLGLGAVYAALGLGLVLTYRGSGVLNFAAGASAAYVAYAYLALREEGQLFVGFMIPLTPEGMRLGVPSALTISVLLAAALGLVQYFLVYRRLRDVGPLARVVASSGVLLVLQAAVILQFGAELQNLQPVLTERPVHALGVAVPADRLILAAIVIAIAFALWALFRFTRFGLATRAAAEKRTGAQLIGLSSTRIEATNWVLSSVLGGIVGILVAPMTTLLPDVYTLMIVPALGAAVLAGFRSFWLAVLGGFGIAISQSLLTYAETQSWYPTANGIPLPGIKAALPFFVIAVVLFARGRRMPDRLTVAAPKLPAAPRPSAVRVRMMISAAIAIGALSLLDFGWRQATINTMIGAIVCLSLIVVTGYIGQLTFESITLGGVAAFVAARLSEDWGIGTPIGPLLGVLIATVVGVLVAIPAIRIRGMQLAVVTLAGAVAVQEVWFRHPNWGGGLQPARAPAPELFGIPFGATDSFWAGDGQVPEPGFGLVVLAVLLFVSILVVNLRRSPSGMRMLAIRSNESAAIGAGVNVARAKLQAFALAGFLGGIAGVLYAYSFGAIGPERFSAITAVSFLAVAYLGGITTVTGAVIAALGVTQGVMFHLTTSVFGIPSEYYMLAGGLGVVTAVLAEPEGAAGVFRHQWDRGRARFAGRSAKRAAARLAR